ncbi:hypothetical protein GCM10017056_00670 [Seohaeicola zhoushanensis]|uniref:Peptidase S24/S26A/S26B/S26C domain-containing protein n=2 Tax=Seohaeicola zhoushanensis TaxID=1569283 RepID=A0A8J3M3D1_9RHOB|nr:hypothetical protein GCM10017056_00670 [Seohaeicola zhoushanensis]
MSHAQARGFAKILGVSLADVLAHAGVLEDEEAQQLAPSYSESDVAPYVPRPAEAAKFAAIARALGENSAELNLWRVKGLALSLAGYLPGDFLLVDATRSELVRSGDVVIAHKYGRNGDYATLLRRYEPPVLISASGDPTEQRVDVVDGRNVVIRGMVIACWRWP